MFRGLPAFLCVALFTSVSATAQVPERKGWVDINVGVATSAQKELTTSVSFPDGGGEFETYKTIYRSPSGASVDFGGGFLFAPKLGIGISFGGTAHEGNADLNIRIPHPYYFNRYAVDDAMTDGKLKKAEGAVHIQFVVQAVDTGNGRVRLYAGPTYFRLTADAISDIRYQQILVGTANLVTVSQYDTEEVEATGWGFHLGADASYFFTNVFGLGGFARLSRGEVTVEDSRIYSADGPVDVKVGGFQAGIGLRFRF